MAICMSMTQMTIVSIKSERRHMGAGAPSPSRPPSPAPPCRPERSDRHSAADGSYAAGREIARLPPLTDRSASISRTVPRSSRSPRLGIEENVAAQAAGDLQCLLATCAGFFYQVHYVLPLFRSGRQRWQRAQLVGEHNFEVTAIRLSAAAFSRWPVDMRCGTPGGAIGKQHLKHFNPLRLGRPRM